MAQEFNGSSPQTGCSTNASTCHPLVQYFGVWNEPDGLNNYNDEYYDPSNLGAYVNDFVSQFLSPAHSGIKAANPSAYVVAPEISTGSSISCGGWTGCGGWAGSWMQPLNSYFSSYYDVISIHGYNAEQTDKSDVLQVFNSYDTSAKPIWLSETAYSSPSNVTSVYVDEYNQSGHWTKVFYDGGFWNTSCSGADTLICSSTGGSSYTTTAFGTAYEQAYAPH